MATGDVRAVGRSEALTTLDEAMRVRGALWLVRGDRGAGRSALLRALIARWRHRKRVVLPLWLPGTGTRQVMAAILDTVAAHLERHSGAFDVVAAVSGVRDRVNGDAGLLHSIHDVAGVLARLVQDEPVVLVVDDLRADTTAEGGAGLLALVEALRAAGVATVIAPHAAQSGPGQLDEIADGVLGLLPMTDDEVTELLYEWRGNPLRKTPDPALTDALRRALGPLWGNPGSIVSTLDGLAADGRIAAVDDHLCLRRADRPVPLPGEHELVRAVREHGRTGERLARVLAEASAPVVDDLPALAAAAGSDLARAGLALDGFVRKGVLGVTRDGTMVVTVPALAARLRPAAPSGGEPPDARAAVRQRLVTGDLGGLADDLRRLGRSAGALDRPARGAVAVCWLAALKHEHRVDEIRATSALLDTLAPDGSPRLGRLLQIAVLRSDAVLAAHLLTALADRGDPDTALGGKLLLGLLATDFRTLAAAWSHWGGEPVPDGVAGTLAEAVAVHDHATFAGTVLGTAHPTGTPALYRRLLAAYSDGHWDDLLSLARRMEADRTRRSRTAVEQLARVFAAEVCGQRGEIARAKAWLEGVSGRISSGHIASWVRCGIRHSAHEFAAAVREGWRDYQRARGLGLVSGADRLLGRLIDYAHRNGDRRTAERALEELDALHDVAGTVATLESLLVFGGLVRGDPADVELGLRLVRRRPNQFRAARACLAMAQVSPDPRPWLLEAHRLAKELGTLSGHEMVVEYMREQGLAVPRPRRAKNGFSPVELRIVDLVSAGLTNRRIAATMRISEKTVESHLTRLFDRTGCRSRVELATARLQGLVPGPAE
ncbi:LuxR family transcriptional regulator [Amycolatopsis minnesotensis]|uniref:LuxR C-terminal-related transcriptional regulator n=1 Tax=Amycolatopsis minnesotensis TaxID=337894 RepID=A0ABN2PZ55_9PSEU